MLFAIILQMQLISLLAILIQFIEEYLLIVRKQIATLLFRTPPQQWNIGPKGNVIILPGFTETWTFLQTCADYLNKLGYRIYVVDTLGRNTSPIKADVEKVKQFIDTKKLDNIIFLTHSKGGIIAKFVIDDLRYASRVKQSISIACPYGGTIWGYLRIFLLAELMPESTIPKQIMNSPERNSKIINFYPKLDNHVIPNKNLILPGAKNICINVIGHTRILEAEATLNIIEKALFV